MLISTAMITGIILCNSKVSIAHVATDVAQTWIWRRSTELHWHATTHRFLNLWSLKDLNCSWLLRNCLIWKCIFLNFYYRHHLFLCAILTWIFLTLFTMVGWIKLSYSEIFVTEITIDVSYSLIRRCNAKLHRRIAANKFLIIRFFNYNL